MIMKKSMFDKFKILIAAAMASSSLLGATTASAADSLPQLIQNLEAGEMQTVVTYGTSLTKVGTWPDQLREVLEQKYPGQVDLINSGKGGSTSVWGGDNFDNKVISKKPDAMFIEFAINDSVGQRMTVAKSRGNLEGMIDRLLAVQPKCEIILMTMNPAVDIHGLRRPNVAAYYQMYRDVAKDRDFLLIDHYPNWKKVLDEDPARFLRYSPDGIHPVREGTLEVVMPEIQAALGLQECKPEVNRSVKCWEYMFKAMDNMIEKDKKVTLKEYQKFWKSQFGKCDQNKDRSLQPDEYVSKPMFQYFDANKDSVISLEEYQAVYAPYFKRGDLDGDNVWVFADLENL
jgi:lysophospholipase L1-like esterase